MTVACAPMPSADASLRRDGDSVHFTGPLTAAEVPTLWAQLQGRPKPAQLQLAGITRLDSAGLAMLARLAEDGPQLHGQPEGLQELCAAYRLDPQLRFQQS